MVTAGNLVAALRKEWRIHGDVEGAVDVAGQRVARGVGVARQRRLEDAFVFDLHVRRHRDARQVEPVFQLEEPLLELPVTGAFVGSAARFSAPLYRFATSRRLRWTRFHRTSPDWT